MTNFIFNKKLTRPEAKIFKLQLYPDGGHILEENKNKMSIYNIFLFFPNRNVTNLKPTPPVSLLSPLKMSKSC